ncbi:MAG: DNA ligase [Propionibacteriales bacterium]|nr:DNA ligase [Propionibacteriales bacterium]
MLATAGELPRDEDGWAFEFKWDGVRALAEIGERGVELFNRSGNPITDGYPELAVLAEVAAGHDLLLDGEIVAPDAAGRPDFGRLQTRMHARQPSAGLLRGAPVAYFAFDLLYLDGQDLTARTYESRRGLLADLDLARPPAVQVPEHYQDVAGRQLLDVATEHRLEGIVAKRLASRYQSGRRSHDWVKIPLRHTCEAVIGGWRPGHGRLTGGLGSLLLGGYDAHGDLVYIGHVGTGFTNAVRSTLHSRLRDFTQPASPFGSPLPREHSRDAVWVRPVLVGSVEYRDLTHDGILRAATWRGLRTDLDPTDVAVPDQQH